MTRRRMLMSMAGACGYGILPALAEDGKPKPSAETSGLMKTTPAALNLADFEVQAREKLAASTYEFIASGAADEITIRWNREAFDNLKLNPRVLMNTQEIDTSVELLGQKLDFPVLLAPTALHRLVHREGEVETARGADAAKAAFVVSSFSTRRLEEIVRATSQPVWFQLYDLSKDRHGFLRDVVQEAKVQGCRALCVTVDASVIGARNRLARAGFRIPEDMETPYYSDRTRTRLVAGLPIMGNFTWDDVAWLRSTTNLPVLLKGIMNPEDAELAIRAGVNGIIVSNHGGRCLDTLPATISALPRIAEKVAGRVPLLLDGGIRRGTDVLKALALGAKAVLIGRPYLYGLTVGGATGVARVVDILRSELKMAMALTGRRSIAEVDRALIW